MPYLTEHVTKYATEDTIYRPCTHIRRSYDAIITFLLQISPNSFSSKAFHEFIC